MRFISVLCKTNLWYNTCTQTQSTLSSWHWLAELLVLFCHLFTKYLLVKTSICPEYESNSFVAGLFSVFLQSIYVFINLNGLLQFIHNQTNKIIRETKKKERLAQQIFQHLTHFIFWSSLTVAKDSNVRENETLWLEPSDIWSCFLVSPRTIL